MRYFDIHTHKQLLEPENSIFSASMEHMPLSGNLHLYSAGIHPWFLTEENAEEQWKWLLDAVHQPRVIAIGECGLDKLKGAPMSLQQQVFIKCIQLSEECSLPLIIHAVKCTEELVRLKKQMKPKCPWVIHGFRGRREVALEYLKHGFYLSFGAFYQVEALRVVPMDKLFIETDESPLSIEEIYQKVANDGNIRMELLTESIRSNVEKVFFIR